MRVKFTVVLKTIMCLKIIVIAELSFDFLDFAKRFVKFLSQF